MQLTKLSIACIAVCAGVANAGDGHLRSLAQQPKCPSNTVLKDCVMPWNCWQYCGSEIPLICQLIRVTCPPEPSCACPDNKPVFDSKANKCVTEDKCSGGSPGPRCPGNLVESTCVKPPQCWEFCGDKEPNMCGEPCDEKIEPVCQCPPDRPIFDKVAVKCVKSQDRCTSGWRFE